MKTQTVLTGTVFFVGAMAAVAVGTLYSWNGLNRPEISLRRALEMATEAIDDDNFYCVDASLLGNKEGTATSGTWNLIFSRTNGQLKYVAVPFNGKMMVTDVLPRLPGPDCKVHSFKDVERVFREILDGLQPDAAIAVEDDEIVISYATRKFLVHTRNEDGTFSDDVHAIVGPSRDGFVMRVREVSSGSEKRDTLFDLDLQSYFNRAPNRFATDDPAKELLVTLDYGERIRQEVVVRLLKPFGPTVWR